MKLSLAISLLLLVGSEHLAASSDDDSLTPIVTNSVGISSRGAINLTCTDSSECHHGKCEPKVDVINGTGITTNVCECDQGYIADEDGTPCVVQQPDKLTAFLLSLFLGTVGADWFYLSNGDAGYVVAGIGKLFMTFGNCCSYCCAACAGICGEHLQSKAVILCLGCMPCFFGLGSSIWWLVDWIRILCDAFADSNGVYPAWH